MLKINEITKNEPIRDQVQRRSMLEIEELPSEDEPIEDPIQQLQRGDGPSALSSDDSQLIMPQPGCGTAPSDGHFEAIIRFLRFLRLTG